MKDQGPRQLEQRDDSNAVVFTEAMVLGGEVLRNVQLDGLVRADGGIRGELREQARLESLQVRLPELACRVGGQTVHIRNILLVVRLDGRQGVSIVQLLPVPGENGERQGIAQGMG